MSTDSLILKRFTRLDAIPKAEWDTLLSPDSPFTDYRFLRALETSGSVAGKTGWEPTYLGVWKGNALVAGCALYAKHHSYGEYIFDWAWAQAYQRYQVPYYPKLLCMVPFTPATGPKFLFSAKANREEVAALLIQAAMNQIEQQNHSSLHYLFIAPKEIPYFEKAGFLIRHSFQYHWCNSGYQSFDDFLGALKPRKRKQIVREQEQLKELNLSFRSLTGAQLTSEQATVFYRFYLSTITKMNASAYLTQSFFEEVFHTMKNETVLFLAEQAGEIIAASLCYFKGKTLYGRYWGATREVRNLHFELCYYQPISWAIERGLDRFEAGAQGEHKIARGFVPTLTYSAHWIRHPQFREAIRSFIEEEKAGIKQLFGQMQEHLPFKAESTLATKLTPN